MKTEELLPELPSDFDPEKPDIDMLDERLWELYVVRCENQGVRPRIKDFLVWLDENYD